MREWIQHDKQQPIDGQDVFYFFDCVGVFKGKYEHPNCYHSKYGFLTGDVTHWMPYDGDDTLPEKPAGCLSPSEIRQQLNREDRMFKTLGRITNIDNDIVWCAIPGMVFKEDVQLSKEDSQKLRDELQTDFVVGARFFMSVNLGCKDINKIKIAQFYKGKPVAEEHKKLLS